MFSGSYGIVFFLNTQIELTGQRIFEWQFKPGFYIYVGSGLKERLSQRILRHIKPAELKKPHWHIDKLLMQPTVQVVKIYIFPSQYSTECFLAECFSSLAIKAIKHFGDSDCHCRSHLFYFGSSFPI